MRVALLGPYPKAEGKIHGGVEAVTSALADGLAAVPEVDVHVVTCVDGLKQPENYVTSTGVNAHLLPLFRVFGCLTGFTVDVRRVRSALRQINPDIVHVHTQLMYGRAAVERGWPSILTVHGIYFRETAPIRGLARVQAKLGCGYEILALRRAKHMSAINRYAINAYGERIHANDIRYIDNPIDDRYFTIPDKAQPGQILFAGIISDRKNLMSLLETIPVLVKSHPYIKLRVAGSIVDRDYYNTCVSYVSQNGLESNVDFLGAVSIEQMLDEHAHASMLVLPSWQETAPVVISESMAAARPVIATDVGGVSEMIDDGKSGFVVQLNDQQQLTASIGRLLSDDSLRKQMGEAGKAIAEARFRRSVVVSKTIAFYKDVIESERKK